MGHNIVCSTLHKVSKATSNLFDNTQLQFLFHPSSNDYTSTCYQCWTCTAFFGGWRLAPPYIAFGVALIMWPHRLWLCYVAGFQLIILAMLRFLTIFRYQFTTDDDGYGDEDLLPQLDNSYEKCDSLTEILDDSMPALGQTFEDDIVVTMTDPNPTAATTTTM